jgi:HlyD family secretion protein
MNPKIKKWAVALTVLCLGIVIGWMVWQALRPTGPGDGFVSGNGRIEATEIDVATKLAGRVEKILVTEGEFVSLGQTLAYMRVDVLDAQHDEAMAQSHQAITAVASAEAHVAGSRSEKAAADAVVVQRESELAAAEQRLVRSEFLSKEGAMSDQSLDDDRATVRAAEAVLNAAKAQVAAAQAATKVAESEVVGAQSGVVASEATVARVQADIEDGELKAPRAGRVQYLVAQPGEVLSSGGKVLNLVDLGDVYMTFYLPETVVGKLELGSEVRLILDAVPQYVFPATISYVSSTAQFTPKTVETSSERQKLMFRVKAQLDPELLQKHLHRVKTGLPGVVWVKIDPKAPWHDSLALKVPQ